MSVGLLEACDDARLFGFPLWPKQRELLEMVERDARLHVWALGRRSGKTTVGALVGLHACLLRPDVLACVRPGERFYAVAVATNLRQARLFVAAARSIVEQSELLASQVVSVSEDEIVFATGGVLAAFPCSSRGGRGWPIACLLMDECAHFVSETEGFQTAERVFEALSPATAQFGDAARIILASTPYGQDGLFADLWQRASNGELPGALAARASTGEMNPTIARAFLEAEEQRDPESFRGEYGADFVASGAAFLDPVAVDAAVAVRGELRPEQASGWVAALDPAFSQDPFGLALVGRDRHDPERLVLGLARAWRPERKRRFLRREEQAAEFSEVVLAEIAATCRRYGARVVTDQYAGPQVVSALRGQGLSVQVVPMTAASKTGIFVELRARLNAGALELYGEPDLLAELRRLRTRFAAGSSQVVNPRVGGSHGDLAQALALAVFEQRGAGSAFPFDSELHVVPVFALPREWRTLEALHLGAETVWLSLVTDSAGNLIVVAEFGDRGLPSKTGPEILALRERRGSRTVCYAGPAELVGRSGNSWGAPASAGDEFARLGLPLVAANEDRAAGFVRLGELLKPDPAHRFPDWHSRAGAGGSPRLFIFDTCPTLAQQVHTAPLEEDDEPLPRAAVSRRWEQLHGAALAALRYGAMSRPSPSEPPAKSLRDRMLEPVDPDWLRAEAVRKHLELVEGPPRRRRYTLI